MNTTTTSKILSHSIEGLQLLNLQATTRHRDDVFD
jgi:hypothetical protein